MSRALAITVAALLLLPGCSPAAPAHDASRPSPSATHGPNTATSAPGLRSVCPKVKDALPTLTASRNRVLSHRAFGYRVVEISQDSDPAGSHLL
jgi:hypothetical protein